MFIAEIQVPVSRVRGVGPANASRLDALGIKTVGDLLAYWPRDWDDRTVRVPLAQWNSAAKINVDATVVAHEWFGFGRMRTLKLVVQDSDGSQAELVCFNRPFLEKSFPIGTEVAVSANFQSRYGTLQASSFDIEGKGVETARVLPVYGLTAGITQAQIRKIIARALTEYCRGIDSELPESVRVSRGLPTKAEIVRLMHAPQSLAEAKRAREALIFEELFLFECAIGRRSIERRGRLPSLISDAAPSPADGSLADAGALLRFPPMEGLQERLRERLPFALTPGQIAAVGEINADLSGESSMARLLQGDVGSGKTLVSFFACLRIIEGGGQCALLAPTELLARQHAETAARLLEPLGVSIAFLTGNIKSAGRARLLAELAAGNVDLVVGTHALFSNGVNYRSLKLVIIDEQHRFGVRQRAAILEKGAANDGGRKAPHFLMMSATPIPRTLALSVFGDLDVSVIRSLPEGRKPIITKLAAPESEERVFDFVRGELARGHQAYFVYPLIEASDALDLKSAEEEFERLRVRVFPGVEVGIIHSRVDEEEQLGTMARFRGGQTKILVATSVVEVGVDVPNATCMVIGHAERFGLSALHQLRGRVGRGESQAWCFLLYSKNLTEDAKARLKVMHETTDGFVVAEEDLRIRGPGEVTGTQQSGYVAFDIADPIRDRALLEEARAEAFAFLTATEKTLKDGA